jgi:hypothetical protein
MSGNASAVASNLLSPITLSFCLGLCARLVRSELSVPKDVYAGISLFLLFALGLKGGVELAEAPFQSIAGPAFATVVIGCLTPLMAFALLRKVGKLSVADSAGIAAHYGSVSAVTFIAAQSFVTELLVTRPDLPPLEGYLPTLLALLESPGIHIALALGVFLGSGARGRSTKSLLHEVLTGRTMMLLVGGLIIGSLIGHKNWEMVAPLYDPKGGIFKGLLCIFLLEMGIVAASRLNDFRKVGVRLLVFGISIPILNAILAIVIGNLSGLSLGGTAVLAAMAASASYIAAPPAVRITLPDANPSYYLTLSLAITFPFNIIVGIPLYFEMADRYFAFVQ